MTEKKPHHLRVMDLWRRRKLDTRAIGERLGLPEPVVVRLLHAAMDAEYRKHLAVKADRLTAPDQAVT